MTSIDKSVPHNARVWDYWLGGKDNFDVDRRMGDSIREMFPVISDVAGHSRRFLRRAVTYLAGEAGVRQFLDIGTGLPTANNTHEVAQKIEPSSRIVYVDNDPLVLVHARALLTSSPEGVTDYVDADVHHVDEVLSGAGRTLDFDQPVAVMMLGILNFVLDDEEAGQIVAELVEAVPSGSYLAITHPTVELGGEMNVLAMEFYNKRARPRIRTRDRAQIAAFVDGLDLVEPGLISAPQWHADGAAAEVPLWAVVARKP
ncbi:SAM-dependent methyltransferase [Actinoplanes sp. NPDC051411]|uniref:SAM-dependent methyltransferase n=1 Tax=Actinoplanes sp. NPDC051411 TaxID=3155522 RepID=UPI003419E89A